EPKQVCFEAEAGKYGGRMRCARGEVPIEAPVRKSHDAVGVRIKACGQAGPARAALRRSGEGLVELDSPGGQRVQVRTHDTFDVVAMEMAAQVVTGHDHYVKGSPHGSPVSEQPISTRSGNAQGTDKSSSSPGLSHPALLP